MTSCGLAGVIPSEMASWSARLTYVPVGEVLTPDGCQSDLPTPLFTLSLIESSFSVCRRLRLNDNRLEGTLPLMLSLLTQLTELDLSGNAFTGPVPASICSMPVLEELYLDNNTLASLPACLPSLLNLRYRGLSHASDAKFIRISLLVTAPLCSRVGSSESWT